MSYSKDDFAKMTAKVPRPIHAIKAQALAARNHVHRWHDSIELIEEAYRRGLMEGSDLRIRYSDSPSVVTIPIETS